MVQCVLRMLRFRLRISRKASDVMSQHLDVCDNSQRKRRLPPHARQPPSFFLINRNCLNPDSLAAPEKAWPIPSPIGTEPPRAHTHATGPTRQLPKVSKHSDVPSRHSGAIKLQKRIIVEFLYVMESLRLTLPPMRTLPCPPSWLTTPQSMMPTPRHMALLP